MKCARRKGNPANFFFIHPSVVIDREHLIISIQKAQQAGCANRTRCGRSGSCSCFEDWRFEQKSPATCPTKPWRSRSRDNRLSKGVAILDKDKLQFHWCGERGDPVILFSARHDHRKKLSDFFVTIRFP